MNSINEITEFISPRPCPIFEPSELEFKDPLTYIAKIKPIAEKYGICKIKPPLNWQPPFAVNIDKVRFTPRLQRLNELEATTRIKLNFLDQIAKFWDLQGFKLRIPQVDRKPLDLYSFYKAVKNEGGYNAVLRDRKWTKISAQLGYSPHTKSIGGILKQHYEKILLPFHLFQSGESLDIIRNKEKYGEFLDIDDKDKNYTPHAIPFRQSLKVPAQCKEGYTRRTKRFQQPNKQETTSLSSSSNNELKRLQFYGAGPKLPGVPNFVKDESKLQTSQCAAATECIDLEDDNDDGSILGNIIPKQSSPKKIKLELGSTEDLPDDQNCNEQPTTSPISIAKKQESDEKTEIFGLPYTSFQSDYPELKCITTTPCNNNDNNNNIVTKPSNQSSSSDASAVLSLFDNLASNFNTLRSGTLSNYRKSLNTPSHKSADHTDQKCHDVNSKSILQSASSIKSEFISTSTLATLNTTPNTSSCSTPYNHKKIATIKPSSFISNNPNPPPKFEYQELNYPNTTINIENVKCRTCGSGDDESRLLLCESCDLSFHTFCLMPPLKEVPKGDWRCPLCIAAECKNLIAPFGFEQSCKEYTLHSFGEMADEFKATYFNMPFHMVPTQTVEKEFWRLVSSIVEDITVCYGADLHCMEHGSGFPTESVKDKFPGEEEYVYSPWNLNNLPVLNKSILKYISGDISGMKVPWMYVGMCFSTFCWHTEDHWSYSINYLHWGEPKTWYGVPGTSAELLEGVMKAQVPELFDAQKDLLHHLVTLMNPNILMANGVPISRCDQYPGEFMVTFPRAYHAGFNQGYNLAEAVNFCPADWIPIGRNCVNHYRELKRFSVFSHDELVCKMAACPEHLDLSIANATLTDMNYMIDEERRLRKILYQKGVTKAEREVFELLSDDERKCEYCNTTCFLSALTCNCLPNKIVCLYHIDRLCNVCQPIDLSLKYRYTLDELPSMYNQLKSHVNCFQNWSVRVKECLEGNKTPSIPLVPPSPEDNGIRDKPRNDEPKPGILKESENSEGNADIDDREKVLLEDLKALYKESLYKKFPPSDLTNLLISQIDKAEKYAERCREMLKKIYLKSTSKNLIHQKDDSSYKERGLFTLPDLQRFLSEIKSLPCTLKEEREIEELVEKVVNYTNRIQEALTDKIPDVPKIEELVQSKLLNLLYVPELNYLKNAISIGIWLLNVRCKLSQPENVSILDIQRLMEHGKSIKKSSPNIKGIINSSSTTTPILSSFSYPTNHPSLDKCLSEMEEIVGAAKAWEEKALQLLSNKSSLTSLEAFMSEMGPVPLHLPYVNEIKDVITNSRNLLKRVSRLLKGLQVESITQVLSTFEQLKSCPIDYEQENKEYSVFETVVHSLSSWRERATRCFFKKNSGCSLLELLCPNYYDTQCNRMENNFKDSKIKPGSISSSSLLSPSKKRKNFVKLDLATKDEHLSHPSVVQEMVETYKKHLKDDGQITNISEDEFNAIMVRIYNTYEAKEFDSVQEIRALNIEKYQMFTLPQSTASTLISNEVGSEDGADEKFCICLKAFKQPMLCCQICREWFHAECVLPNKVIQTLTTLAKVKKNQFNPTIAFDDSATSQNIMHFNPEQPSKSSNLSNLPYVNLDGKYLCANCSRSRRPKFETAFSLYLSLVKIPMKTLEGVTLQGLTERAIKWQEKVQKFLNKSDVVLFVSACKERKTVKRIQKSSQHFGDIKLQVTQPTSTTRLTNRFAFIDPDSQDVALLNNSIGGGPSTLKFKDQKTLDILAAIKPFQHNPPSTNFHNLKSVKIGTLNLNAPPPPPSVAGNNSNNNKLRFGLTSPISLSSNSPLPTSLATLSIQKLTDLMAGTHQTNLVTSLCPASSFKQAETLAIDFENENEMENKSMRSTPELTKFTPTTLKFPKRSDNSNSCNKLPNRSAVFEYDPSDGNGGYSCINDINELENLNPLHPLNLTELEGLMLEGDLIELTLHETQYLWELYKEALLVKEVREKRDLNVFKNATTPFSAFNTHYMAEASILLSLGDISSVYHFMCNMLLTKQEPSSEDNNNAILSSLNKFQGLSTDHSDDHKHKRKQNLSKLNGKNRQKLLNSDKPNSGKNNVHHALKRKKTNKQLSRLLTNKNPEELSDINPDALQQLGDSDAKNADSKQPFSTRRVGKKAQLLARLKRSKKLKQIREYKLQSIRAKPLLKPPSELEIGSTLEEKGDQDEHQIKSEFNAEIASDDSNNLKAEDVIKVEMDELEYEKNGGNNKGSSRVRRKPIKYLNTLTEIPLAAMKQKVGTNKKDSKATKFNNNNKKPRITTNRSKVGKGGSNVSDENSKCSLPDCLEPSGSDITWIQCDGRCEGWFHMACIGLNQFQISDNDDYYCYKCKNPTIATADTEDNLMTSKTSENFDD